MVETINRLDEAIEELQDAVYSAAWTEKWKVIELQEHAKIIRTSLATLGEPAAQEAAVEFLQVHEEVMQALKKGEI
jgi:hypothetical protein